MNGMMRRFGVVIIAVAALSIAGLRAAQAQAQARPGPEPRAKGRLVPIPGHIVDLDQIQYVRLSRDGTETGRAEVFFAGRPDPLIMAGEATRQLIAAIRGANPGHVAKDEANPDGSRFLAFDGFDGKLALDWKPVRPDPSHASLAKNPGSLTITTQRGSIHGAEAQDEFGGGLQARNLYLIDVPLAKGSDFVATTCIVGFIPEVSYQQAGLIVYNDDDNYVKWGYEYEWKKEGGQAFRCVVEKDAVPMHHDVESESGLGRYWLRLTKRGDRYEYASSTDGRVYRVHGEATWGDGAPGRVGILAKNGGNKDAGEADAAFDFFELRTPAPARAAGQPPEE